MTEFEKYASLGRGLSTNTLDRYARTAAYINPTVIEERKLNATSIDVFSRLLMAFGKVPQSVSSYQKAVIPPVGNHASCGIHFLELGAEIPVGLFLVLDRDIDPCQGA